MPRYEIEVTGEFKDTILVVAESLDKAWDAAIRIQDEGLEAVPHHLTEGHFSHKLTSVTVVGEKTDSHSS